MRCRYLVPTLGLMAFTGVGHAADVGGGVEINGYVDSILGIVDDDTEDDTVIDFSATALLQTSASIGDEVGLQIDVFYNDDNSIELVQAYSTWALTEEFSLQFGKSISWLGWQTRYATGLYRINGTNYIGNFYGADTNGIWGTYSAGDVTVTGTIVDDVNEGGTKTSATDAIGAGIDVVVGLEGFGSVNLEGWYDQEGADYYDSAAEADADALGLGLLVTADQVIEDMLFGGEILMADFDTASSYAAMVMANYVFDENASATVMLSYFEPNDDVDDDETMEIAVAVLTTPTGDSNFAINAEVNYITAEADDSDSFGIFLEALAVIP